jgi:hypothetical protein
VWKFLGVTSAADLVKFSTTYYHPIKTLTAEPPVSDTYYNQWIAQVRSANYKGGIYAINVTGKGIGYQNDTGTVGSGGRIVTDSRTDTDFKVIGDGAGLQCTVTYGPGGTIESVDVTNPGSGYTFASVTASFGSGATFDLIFTPKSGLGVNPILDVVARYMIINMKLDSLVDTAITTSNDYRKISLVYKPYNYGTTTIANSSILSVVTTLQLEAGTLGSGAYNVDAIITGATSGARGRVVDWDNVTGQLRIIRTSDENSGYLGASSSFAVLESITTSSGTGLGHVASISLPTVQANTGDIYYSEYRKPINRSVGQSESLNVIVKY